MTPLKQEYEQVLASAPPLHAESKTDRAGVRLVLGIGSILTSVGSGSNGIEHKRRPRRASAPIPHEASASIVVSDEETSEAAREKEIENVVRAKEATNVRKFEKIRRTTTPRNLEAGLASPPQYYKKRLQSPENFVD